MVYNQSTVAKKWAVVYQERILLEAETEGELRKMMDRTRVPEGGCVCAMPKCDTAFYI
jgi:hypothetical protein